MTASNVRTHDELEVLAQQLREHEIEVMAKFDAHKSVFGEDAPYFSEGTYVFWATLEKGTFTLSRCTSCSHVYFPPRVICPQCWVADAGVPLATRGKGSLVSFTDLHVTAPKLQEIAPIRMAIVDLDEGVRLLTWLRGPGAGEAKVGQKCGIVVERLLGRNWFVAQVDV